MVRKKNTKPSLTFRQTTVCIDCPFRADGKGVKLYKSRIIEIVNSLNRETFSCHKTIKCVTENDNISEQHCVGALLFTERRPAYVLKIAESLKLLDYKKLCRKTPVYSSVEEMLEKQSFKE